MKRNEQRLYLVWRYVTLFVLIAFVVAVSFRLFSAPCAWRSP